MIGQVAHSTDYYVCDTGGNDSNNGTSTSTPWLTLDKALTQMSSLAAGDNISFCKKGVFTQSSEIIISGAGCTAANQCEIKAYGFGANPILNGSSYDLFSFTKAAAEVGGFVLRDLRLVGNGTNKGVFVTGGIGNINLINVSIDTFSIGVHVVSTTAEPAVNVYLQSSSVINNTDHGYLGVSNYGGIYSTTFDNNAGGSIELVGDTSVRFDASGNTITRNGHSGGSCIQPAIFAYGTFDKLRMEDNNISEVIDTAGSACAGIIIQPNLAGQESFENVSITGNRIAYMGLVSIGGSSIDTADVRNNRIVVDNAFASYAIRIPNGTEDTLLSTNITAKGNRVFLYDDTAQKVGIKIMPVNTIYKLNTVIMEKTGDKCFHYSTGADLQLTNLCVEATVNAGDNTFNRTTNNLVD